jgi:hypothetical protein
VTEADQAGEGEDEWSEIKARAVHRGFFSVTVMNPALGMIGGRVLDAVYLLLWVMGVVALWRSVTRVGWSAASGVQERLSVATPGLAARLAAVREEGSRLRRSAFYRVLQFGFPLALLFLINLLLLLAAGGIVGRPFALFAYLLLLLAVVVSVSNKQVQFGSVRAIYSRCKPQIPAFIAFRTLLCCCRKGSTYEVHSSLLQLVDCVSICIDVASLGILVC